MYLSHLILPAFSSSLSSSSSELCKSKVLPIPFAEMGSCRNFMRGRHKLHHLSFPFLFLLISSWTQFLFVAEGRAFLRPADRSKEEKIGSKPPQCEKRCSSCGHCRAIQVPINPQTRTGSRRNSSGSLSTHYARADDGSNYKPLSWMCKCGNFFFNP